MANVVRDPRKHPDAIIPDLSKPDPLVSFSKDDIAFVYGSRWKQRYFTKIGDDYYPEPAQWDVTHKRWRRYFVPNDADWWAPLYPADNFKRPTGPLCDGCHSVNYDIATKTVSEWNVGCERCHGAGSAHVAKPTRDNIFNPARFNYVRANDALIQCHSQGRPLTNPIEGKKNRAQEPHAGQRFRSKPHVRARRHVFQLPRSSRHGKPGDAARTGQRDVPDLSWPQQPEWAACRQHRAAHASRCRQHGERLRRLSHAVNRRDSRRRESPQPHVSFRLAWSRPRR